MNGRWRTGGAGTAAAAAPGPSKFESGLVDSVGVVSLVVSGVASLIAALLILTSGPDSSLSWV
jgi:hypothetical protein